MRSSAEGGRTRRCSRCGGSGHMNQRCHNPNLLDSSSTPTTSNVIPENSGRKYGICHNVGHNRLTCPQCVTGDPEIPNPSESTSGSSSE